MAVKIRMQRTGRHGLANYRIVVADSHSPRDGRFIEILGTYDPTVTPAKVKIDAERAYKKVLKYAGASDKRDFADNRIVQAVETYISGSSDSKGLIRSPKDVGNYPEYKTDVPQLDSDGDGIPDEWEFNHNLNPYDGGDVKSLTKTGYTNLEIYLNSLVEDLTKQQNTNVWPNFDTIKMFVQNTANKFKKH